MVSGALPARRVPAHPGGMSYSWGKQHGVTLSLSSTT